MYVFKSESAALKCMANRPWRPSRRNDKVHDLRSQVRTTALRASPKHCSKLCSFPPLPMPLVPCTPGGALHHEQLSAPPYSVQQEGDQGCTVVDKLVHCCAVLIAPRVPLEVVEPCPKKCGRARSCTTRAANAPTPIMLARLHPPRCTSKTRQRTNCQRTPMRC